MSFYRPYRAKQAFYTPQVNQYDGIMKPHNPYENLQGVALISNTMGGTAFTSNTLGSGYTDALNLFQFANMLFPK